nr:uncharacterized protein LOC106031985 isoform X3 [Anser cygnoides]
MAERARLRVQSRDRAGTGPGGCGRATGRATGTAPGGRASPRGPCVAAGSGLAAGRALGAFRDAGCHLAPSGISRPVGGAPRGAADPTGGLTGTSNSFLPVTELYLEGVPPLPSAFDANCYPALWKLSQHR